MSITNNPDLKNILSNIDKAEIENFINMLNEKNCPFPRFVRRRMIKQLKKIDKEK